MFRGRTRRTRRSRRSRLGRRASRSDSGSSRSASRSRSRTPVAMRAWVNQLAPNVTYQFRTADNQATQVGQYIGRQGNNFIFIVNGNRTTYPMRIIATMQPRARLPGFDGAFVRVDWKLWIVNLLIINYHNFYTFIFLYFYRFFKNRYVFEKKLKCFCSPYSYR